MGEWILLPLAPANSIAALSGTDSAVTASAATCFAGTVGSGIPAAGVDRACSGCRQERQRRHVQENGMVLSEGFSGCRGGRLSSEDASSCVASGTRGSSATRRDAPPPTSYRHRSTVRISARTAERRNGDIMEPEIETSRGTSVGAQPERAEQKTAEFLHGSSGPGPSPCPG